MIEARLPRLTRIAKRLLLMVGGEALQSFFHFALNIALIRLMSAEGYGSFAIVMVIGGLGITYIRAFTAMPVSVWIGKSHKRGAADAYEVTFGTGALLLSIAMGAGAAALFAIWLNTSAIAGGAFIALWSLRSHMRVAFFSRGRTKIVSLSDLAFTLGGAALATVALRISTQSLFGVFLALAAANGLGIAVLLVLAGRPFRLSVRAPMRRRYGRLLRPLGWSGLSVTLANLQGQGVALLVAAVAGPAHYAPIAAILVLFVPLRIAASALVNMMQPELSAMLAQGKLEAVWRQSLSWTAFMSGVGIVYGGLMLLALPFIRSPVLAGPSLYVIALFAWLIYTMTMAYVMPRIVLEAMTAFKTVALITACGAVLGLVSIRAILFVASPAWSLGGGALSEMVVLAGSWIAFRRALLSRAGRAEASSARTGEPASPSRPPALTGPLVSGG